MGLRAMLTGMINPEPGRAIALETHLGEPIPNWIDADMTLGMVAFARQQYAQLLNNAGVRQVGPSTGRYNCHGLVFASRRTNVPPAGVGSTGLIDRVLQEDQFFRVAEADAKEGDLVVWRQQDEVDHTGIVCHLERHPIRVLFVWSMWGGLGEFVHRLPLTPYNDCSIEFWRLG